MTTNRYLGGYQSTPFTFGDTYEPNEARGEFAVGSMEKNSALLREPCGSLGSHQFPADYSWLGAR